MAALVIVLVMLVGAPAVAADRVSNMYAHQVDLLENDLVSLARAMPAEKYDFRPANGTFTSARTFGEQVKHIATMILEYLTHSIEYAKKAMASLNEQNQLDALKTYFGSQTRVEVAAASRTTATATTARWLCTRA